MNAMRSAGTTPSAEIVARTLRHEVGDLLQVVYATTALLEERLPAGPDRRLLTDLRNRAEMCKHELDAVHDLIRPPEATLEPTDVSELVNRLTRSFAVRFPSLKVCTEVTAGIDIAVDERRLSQAVTFLLLNACQAARERVDVSAAFDHTEAAVVLAIQDDGPGWYAEQEAWLATPFRTTWEARVGLGLALACRVAEAHGGRVETSSLPSGGKRVVLIVPVTAVPT